MKTVVFTRSIVALILLSTLAACGKKQAPKSLTQSRETKLTLSIGGGPAEISVKTTELVERPSRERYLLAFSPSPGDTYFEATGELRQQLIKDLVEKDGFIVTQVKYLAGPVPCADGETMTGFYSAACGRGLDAVFAHSKELYEAAARESGYTNSTNPDKKIMGLGLSLGEVLLTLMLDSEAYFDRLAWAGIVYGDVEAGCNMLRVVKKFSTKMAQEFFSSYSDSLTKTKNGCTSFLGIDTEYESNRNFDNLKHADKYDLAIFEGDKSYDIRGKLHAEFDKRVTLPGWLASLTGHIKSFAAWAGGMLGITDKMLDFNPAQFVIDARKANGAGDRTQVNWYKNCGHDPWGCPDGASRINQDIRNYLTR